MSYLFTIFIFKKEKIEMKTIDNLSFYKSSRKVEIRSNNQTILIIYLKDKKKRKTTRLVSPTLSKYSCLFLVKMKQSARGPLADTII